MQLLVVMFLSMQLPSRISAKASPIHCLRRTTDRFSDLLLLTTKQTTDPRTRTKTYLRELFIRQLLHRIVQSILDWILAIFYLDNPHRVSWQMSSIYLLPTTYNLSTYDPIHVNEFFSLQIQYNLLDLKLKYFAVAEAIVCDLGHSLFSF
jgi:hypothetical protein